MLTRLAVGTRSLAIAATVLASRAVAAQAPLAPAQACVLGAPVFDATDTLQTKLLARLQWRSDEYDSLFRTKGPLAVYDTIRARGNVLFAASVGAVDTVSRLNFAALGRTIDSARAPLLRASFVSGKLVFTGALKPRASVERPGDVSIGDNVSLSFAPTRRVASTAICAMASNANRFLASLLDDSLNALANRYAAISRRWDQFTGSTYSLTLVERLAASCHLPVIDWLLSPTSRCWTRRRTRWTEAELEPPTWRTVFVHPTAGLRPVLKADSAFQSAAQIEWYGFLHHSYGPKRVLTFGATAATVHFESGQSRLGGVLHTPIGKIGIFGRSGQRLLVTVSADVLGWVPGVRKAADQLRLEPLQDVLGQLSGPVK